MVWNFLSRRPSTWTGTPRARRRLPGSSQGTSLKHGRWSTDPSLLAFLAGLLPKCTSAAAQRHAAPLHRCLLRRLKRCGLCAPTAPTLEPHVLQVQQSHHMGAALLFALCQKTRAQLCQIKGGFEAKWAEFGQHVPHLDNSGPSVPSVANIDGVCAAGKCSTTFGKLDRLCRYRPLHGRRHQKTRTELITAFRFLSADVGRQDDVGGGRMQFHV